MKERKPYLQAYTAREALEEGLLEEISPQLRRQAGYRIPVRITPGVAHLITPSRQEEEGGQSLQGRVYDLLHSAHLALSDGDPQTTIAAFDFMLGTRTVSLWASLDISDGPAIHIITPEEY